MFFFFTFVVKSATFVLLISGDDVHVEWFLHDQQTARADGGHDGDAVRSRAHATGRSR